MIRARTPVVALVGAMLLVAAPAFAQPKPAPTPLPAPNGKDAAPPKEKEAPPPKPTYRKDVPILTLSSEDVEDQAEALSGALRSRFRERPGSHLDEATTNLSTLMAALGCAERPDPLCLIKIGDQMKVERFVWGTLRKGPDKHQVTAEIHLWRRGKADQVANETFSDNLHDQNDDVLRRIAGRLLDKLFGEPLAAAITVRVAGDSSGQVLVDGTAYDMERGEATVELKPGHHVVEVRANGYKPHVQGVDVAASSEQVLNVRLTPDSGQKEEAPSKPISTRTLVSLGLLAVGTGFGVAGTIKGAEFLSIREDNKRDHDTLNATDFCDPSKPHTSSLASMQDACDRKKSGESALKLELIFYGVAALVGGAGVVMLVTDTPDAPKETAQTPLHRRLHVTPAARPGGGSVDVSLRF